MKQVKEAKNIEVLVNISYAEENNELVQTFSFFVSNKRYLTYLFDARFLFKQKIEKLIEELLLEGYKRRADMEGEIKLYYDIQPKPQPIIRKICAYVPPNCGCAYCSKAVKEGEFVFCPEKNKHYHKSEGIGRCPVFRCKEEILT